MEKPKKLAIRGKVINIEKIGEKSQAQFAAQLKQNGIVLEAEELERLYKRLTGTDEELNAAIAEAKAKAEARKAEIAAKHEAKKLNRK